MAHRSNKRMKSSSRRNGLAKLDVALSRKSGCRLTQGDERSEQRHGNPSAAVEVASQGVRRSRVAGIPYAAIPGRLALACDILDSPDPKPPKKRALNDPGAGGGILTQLAQGNGSVRDRASQHIPSPWNHPFKD